MPILIDGHIHIHPSVNIDILLDAAWQNFTSVITQLFPESTSYSYVLLLAEGKKNNIFQEICHLAKISSGNTSQTWHFERTAEDNSIFAIQEEKKILLVAGRQLISSEKLELLSLFSPQLFPDYEYSLNELASRVTRDGGLPVLAWGVGKWLGYRGKVIQSFINQPSVSLFFVGDNGNRPVFWPYPKLLASSEKNGIPSIAGSDPLPIVKHEQRAGSYGTAVKSNILSVNHPAAELRQLLISTKEFIPFGKRVGYIQFFKDQVLVNLQKRLGSDRR